MLCCCGPRCCLCFTGAQFSPSVSYSQSSVRHALFQRWFVKVLPSSLTERSCFWGLNYANKPREWSMPDPSDESPRHNWTQAAQVESFVDPVPDPAGVMFNGADAIAGTSSHANWNTPFWSSSSATSGSPPAPVRPPLYLPAPSGWKSTEDGFVWAHLRHDGGRRCITPATTTASWATPPPRTGGYNTVSQVMLPQPPPPPFQQWDWYPGESLRMFTLFMMDGTFSTFAIDVYASGSKLASSLSKRCLASIRLECLHE